MASIVSFLPAAASLPGERLLAAFDAEDARWISVNDDVMGGRSRGAFRIADGALAFEGTLNTDGGGFASIRTRPGALDLAGTEGIRLRVRGDGRAYSFRLRQKGDGEVSYRAAFRTAKGRDWQDVWLPYASFRAAWRGRTLDRPPVDPARVESIGITIADKRDGAFRLLVDRISAYPPFSLDDYRWKRRPMLVFAPDERDRRLARQLAAVRETLDAFRDRDMVLIVVLANGASSVDGRPLAESAVRSLRGRFRVAADAFAVRLVGKDGGVKRAADEPVALAAWYGLIDGMPMRRAEIASRNERR